MPTVEANGINIYYEIHGNEEGEPVIFANGVFANTLSWFNQAPVFSKKYKVILYDMRGQGQSDHPDGNYTIELHAEDQKALLDGLSIHRVNHIGISYGA
ncbi:MAG: alpha/beta fold hydrolase, partial [Candidatus Heimdallarchaeota archaeon]